MTAVILAAVVLVVLVAVVAAAIALRPSETEMADMAICHLYSMGEIDLATAERMARENFARAPK